MKGPIQTSEMARRTLVEMKNEAMMRGRPTDSVPFTADRIQKAVKVTNPPGTHLLVMTADADDREQATQVAEAAARGVANWRQEDAQRRVGSAVANLKRETARAKKALVMAGRQELDYKTKIRTNGPSDDFQGILLKENTEIVTKLYQQLQTALDVALLQENSVSGDVLIVQHATAPMDPQQAWVMFAPRP